MTEKVYLYCYHIFYHFNIQSWFYRKSTNTVAVFFNRLYYLRINFTRWSDNIFANKYYNTGYCFILHSKNDFYIIKKTFNFSYITLSIFQWFLGHITGNIITTEPTDYTTQDPYNGLIYTINCSSMEESSEYEAYMEDQIEHIRNRYKMITHYINSDGLPWPVNKTFLAEPSTWADFFLWKLLTNDNDNSKNMFTKMDENKNGLLTSEGKRNFGPKFFFAILYNASNMTLSVNIH